MKYQEQRKSNVEITDISKLIEARARVTKHELNASIAVQMARFEKEMATIYDAQDVRWASLYEDMHASCERMSRELVERCDAVGIPPRFRPQFNVWWHYHGENYNRERRAELRKLAQATLEARCKAAIASVDQSVAEVMSQLNLHSLATKEPKACLHRMPTVEQLMPQLRLDEIDKQLPTPRE